MSAMRKAQPTTSAVHVNRPLTNISVAYIQAQSRFAASKTFPIVPVVKKSDQYFLYDKGDWLRSQAQRRAPATESAGTGWNLSTDTYIAERWALHKDIDDETRTNADAPLNMDRDATEFLTQQMMIKMEEEFVADFFVNGVWANSVIPGTLWSAANSDPIGDIRLAKSTILNTTGFEGNNVTVAKAVHDVLVDHPDITDRVKYTQRAVITNEILAALFEVDSYTVTSAVRNTAVEGAADAVAPIAADNVLVTHSAGRPSLLTPSAGYTYMWTGLLGAGNNGTRIKRFRKEEIESDRIEIDSAWDQKLVATDLGYLILQPIA